MGRLKAEGMSNSIFDPNSRDWRTKAQVSSWHRISILLLVKWSLIWKKITSWSHFGLNQKMSCSYLPLKWHYLEVIHVIILFEKDYCNCNIIRYNNWSWGFLMRPEDNFFFIADFVADFLSWTLSWKNLNRRPSWKS